MSWTRILDRPFKYRKCPYCNENAKKITNDSYVCKNDHQLDLEDFYEEGVNIHD